MPTIEIEVLTVAEAARVLRLSLNSTYSAIHRGEIPHRKVGRRIIIPRDALHRFLTDSQTTENAQGGNRGTV